MIKDILVSSKINVTTDNLLISVFSTILLSSASLSAAVIAEH